MCFAFVVLMGVRPAHASHASTLVNWINKARAQENLPPVKVHADLVDDARSHAANMARRGSSFNHPNLRSVIAGRVRLTHFSERSLSLLQAFEGALRSAHHRAQIYGDYEYIGVGVVRSGEYFYMCWFLMDPA